MGGPPNKGTKADKRLKENKSGASTKKIMPNQAPPFKKQTGGK